MLVVIKMLMEDIVLRCFQLWVLRQSWWLDRNSTAVRGGGSIRGGTSLDEEALIDVWWGDRSEEDARTDDGGKALAITDIVAISVALLRGIAAVDGITPSHEEDELSEYSILQVLVAYE